MGAFKVTRSQSLSLTAADRRMRNDGVSMRQERVPEIDGTETTASFLNIHVFQSQDALPLDNEKHPVSTDDGIDEHSSAWIESFFNKARRSQSMDARTLGSSTDRMNS